MAFNRAEHFVLDQCTMTDVAGNVNVDHMPVTVNMHVQVHGSTVPSSESGLVLSNLPQLALASSSLDSLSQLVPFPLHSLSWEKRVEEPTVLVIQIQKLLFGSPRLHHPFKAIKADLDALLRSLHYIQFGYAILQHTPISQGIRKFLGPKLDQCAGALRRLHQDIIAHYDALQPTIIGRLWKDVYWAGNGTSSLAGTLNLMRAQIEVIRYPLETMLAAITSDVWTQLVKGSSVPLREIEAFYTQLRLHIPSLNYIKFSM